jgi:hypothetical protein
MKFSFVFGTVTPTATTNALVSQLELIRKFVNLLNKHGRLCGLVVRVLGYRSGGPGLIPGTTRKKVVGLERSSLSLVGTTEELFDRKVAAPV